MATKVHEAQQANWWTWLAAAVAVIVAIAAFGYWMDWFGAGTTDVAAPAVEETAPATE